MYKITFFLPIILLFFSLQSSQEIGLLSNDIPPSNIQKKGFSSNVDLSDDLTKAFPNEIITEILSHCDYNTKKKLLYLNTFYNGILQKILEKDELDYFCKKYPDLDCEKVLCIYNTTKQSSSSLRTAYISRSAIFNNRFNFLKDCIDDKAVFSAFTYIVTSEACFKDSYNLNGTLYFKDRYDLMDFFTTFIYNSLKKNLDVSLPFNIILPYYKNDKKNFANYNLNNLDTFFWYFFLKKVSIDQSFNLYKELIVFINYFFTIISFYNKNHFICYKNNEEIISYTKKQSIYCRNEFKKRFKKFDYECIINICNYFLDSKYNLINKNEDISINIKNLKKRVLYFCLLFIRTNPLPFLSNITYYKEELNKDIYLNCLENALFGLYDLFYFKNLLSEDQNINNSRFPNCRECYQDVIRYHNIEDINDMDLDWNKKCILGHNNENYIAKLKKFNKQNNISLPHFSKQLQNITIPNDDIHAIFDEEEIHGDVPLSIKTIYNKLCTQKKSSLFSKKTICFTSFFISILLYSIYVYFNKNSSSIKTTSSIDMPDTPCS